MVKRIVHIAKNQEEARQWDIQQALEMTHEQRQEIARTLKRRAYGTDTPDVRSWQRQKDKRSR